jgi:hypothetical protein
MAKKARKRDLVALWQGRVRKVISQSSGPEVQVLLNLTWHKGLTSEQKYLVLERAIFDVWSEREADREEEAKARRKRTREQAKQEHGFAEPAADAHVPAEPDHAEHEPHDVPSWAPHDEIERGPHAPEHEGMSPDK